MFSEHVERLLGVAKCKSEGHCLQCLHHNHMLPSSHPSSHVMVLRPRGHDYDVPRVTYDLRGYKAVVYDA